MAGKAARSPNGPNVGPMAANNVEDVDKRVDELVGRGVDGGKFGQLLVQALKR
jgi:hypothetical protein